MKLIFQGGMSLETSEALKQPLKIKQKLLLGPGPSNPHPAIYDAMAQPILGYINPDFLKVPSLKFSPFKFLKFHSKFSKIMDETKAGIQYLFQTSSRYTFAISGTGHSGMEAALVNLVSYVIVRNLKSSSATAARTWRKNFDCSERIMG